LDDLDGGFLRILEAVEPGTTLSLSHSVEFVRCRIGKGSLMVEIKEDVRREGPYTLSYTLSCTVDDSYYQVKERDFEWAFLALGKAASNRGYFRTCSWCRWGLLRTTAGGTSGRADLYCFVETLDRPPLRERRFIKELESNGQWDRAVPCVDAFYVCEEFQLRKVYLGGLVSEYDNEFKD
jgi:hypothetical protein